MIIKRSPGETAFTVFNYIALGLLSFITLYPFVNLLAISFSGASPVRKGIVYLIPLEPHFMTYEYLADHNAYWDAFKFTVLITILGTAVSIIATCILAYPMSKKDFKLKGFMTAMVVVTMFFSGGLIPEYILYKSLNLIDNIWVYIIPGAVSTWNLLILRNFFMEIPDSIEESALIDGANEIVTLFKIVIPMSLPAIATVTLWYAVSKWNTFYSCIMFTSSVQLRTLQVALRSIVIENDSINDMILRKSIFQGAENKMTPQSVKAAAIVVTTLPMLIVYPFLQKYFVKGVIVGSLKG